MSCQPGQIASIEVSTTGNTNCVGVRSVVYNSDNTITITLTNGATMTTPSLKGPTGATGPTGPAGEAGGGVIENDASIVVNTLTTDEVLKSASTLVADARKNLTNDGDMLRIKMFFTRAEGAANGSDVALGINGAKLNIASFGNDNVGAIEIQADVIRISSTVVYISAKSKLLGESMGDLPLAERAVIQPFSYEGSYGVNDFGVSNNTFDAMCNQAGVGDITCTLLSAEIIKIIL